MQTPITRLREIDDKLLENIFNEIKQQVDANPYSDDGLFAEQIRKLPIGLRRWLQLIGLISV